MEAKEFQTLLTAPVVSAHFAAEWSGDDRVSIITEKGLQVMELVPSPNSPAPRLSLKRSLLKPGSEVPTDSTDVDYNTLIHEMNDRVSVHRLILVSTLTPSLENSSLPPPRFTQVAWSPRGLLHYDKCLLATLTNYGSVKVEYSWNRHWRKVMDVSESWAAVCRLGWEGRGSMDQEEQYHTLVSREAQLRIVALTWSDLRGKPPHGQYSLLATAHRDGVISVWRIPVVRPIDTGSGAESDEAGPEHGLAFTLQTATTLISELRWLAGMDSDLLLVGDGRGCVRMWDASPPADGEVAAVRDLYPTADRIKVTRLVDWPLRPGGSERLVAIVKMNYLVVVLLDASGQTIATDIQYFQHVAITGLVVTTPGSLVMCAREGVFYHVECCLEDGSMTMNLSPLPTPLNFTYNSCFGLAASEHRMIWVAVSSVSKMYDHLVVKQPTSFSFMNILNPTEAVAMLVDNPSNRLTRHLDCLEILRVQCQKLGQRPPIDVTLEDLDPLTNYQLKLSLWLTSVALTISADYEEEHTRQLKYLQHRIRQLLFARHACQRVQSLLAAVVRSGASEDELSCISLLRTWMLTFNKTPVASTHWKDTCSRVSAVLAGSQGLEELIKEYCHICEAEVESTWIQGEQWLFATCTNGHSVSRCSMSLLPCVSLPYFTCPTCRILAHPAFVSDQEPLCVFCDGVLRPDESIIMDSAQS